MVSHRALQSRWVGASTQSTLRKEKHFNSTPTINSFTHTGIWQWERNEDILISGIKVYGQ